jgi:hypothetical protein
VSLTKKFGNVVASPREVAKANIWLRKHAEDIKGLDDAKHLRPSPAAPPSPPGNTTAGDPTCDFCNSPIFEEYRDAKHPDFCTRPKCQKKRRKFELQQEARASGELDLIASVDDPEDKDEDRWEDSDAVTDAEELPRKVFAVEASTENDLRTSSAAEDDEDKDEEEEEFEDDDEPLDQEDEEPSGEEDEDDSEEEDDDESEESPEGTSTTKIKVKRDRTRKIRSDGEGVVPVVSDFSGDDQVPLLVRIRNGFRPPDKGTKPLLPGVEFFSTRRCEAHGVDACVTCFPVSNADILRQRKVIDAIRDQEDAERWAALVEAGRVPEPPPKNELEAIERDAKRIEKERVEKEETERRKIVRKHRIRLPKPKETPNLRRQYEFSTRQLADVMDTPLFNKSFPVKDRSLLFDNHPNRKFRNIYHKWYTQIAKNAKDRGVPISKGSRRGDYRYENVFDKQEKMEFEIIDGKPVVVSAGYIPPVMQMINGCACFVDAADQVPSLPAPPKTRTEVLSDGSTKVHVVKQLAMPDKIKRASGPKFPVPKSPSTYGELINALPYRWETMLTSEETDFYKDYADRNLTAAQLKVKHGEKTDEDILLLENRAIRHAFKLRLLDPPLEELMYRDFELDLDEAYKLDAIMVGKSGGGYVNGRVTGGKLDRYGRTMKLNSFRTRPIREGGGGPSQADNGAPDYDDFGDESAA